MRANQATSFKIIALTPLLPLLLSHCTYHVISLLSVLAAFPNYLLHKLHGNVAYVCFVY